MNRNHILHWARNSGINVKIHTHEGLPASTDEEFVRALKKFAEYAASHERKACLKLCEGWSFVPGGHEFTPQELVQNLSSTIATQIQARGEK